MPYPAALQADLRLAQIPEDAAAEAAGRERAAAEAAVPGGVVAQGGRADQDLRSINETVVEERWSECNHLL